MLKCFQTLDILLSNSRLSGTPLLSAFPGMKEIYFFVQSYNILVSAHSGFRSSQTSFCGLLMYFGGLSATNLISAALYRRTFGLLPCFVIENNMHNAVIMTLAIIIERFGQIG